ncbi:hypothetical protein Q7P35_002716 [Cladosporium inversicolor]
MVLFKFLILAASILARSSFALPTKQFDIDILDDHNDIPLNVTNSRMMRRQQEDRNLVFVAPGEIQTYAWYPARDFRDSERPTAPPGFTELWDNVVEASCNPTRCGRDIGKVTAQAWTTYSQRRIEMYLEGTFAPDMRDNLFSLLRQAFDRAVTRNWAGDEVEEWGPRDMDAYIVGNNHLRSVLKVKGEDEGGCGEVVDRINALGGLIHPFFGLVEAICAAANPAED